MIVQIEEKQASLGHWLNLSEGSDMEFNDDQSPTVQLATAQRCPLRRWQNIAHLRPTEVCHLVLCAAPPVPIFIL